MLRILCIILLITTPVWAGTVYLQDEGTGLGSPSKFNCVGAAITCTKSGSVGTLTVSGATDLDDLTDVNSATATRGHLLVANGSTWDSTYIVDNTTNGREILKLTNSGTGSEDGVLIDDNDTSGGAGLRIEAEEPLQLRPNIGDGNALDIYSNLGTRTVPSVRIFEDHASTTQALVELGNDGTGAHITTIGTNEDLEIDPNGTGEIDLISDTINFGDGTTLGTTILVDDSGTDSGKIQWVGLINTWVFDETGLASADSPNFDMSGDMDVSGDVSIGGNLENSISILNDINASTATKGNLLVGETGDTGFNVLEIGAAGTFLTIDSSTQTGLKWSLPQTTSENITLTTTSFDNILSSSETTSQLAFDKIDDAIDSNAPSASNDPCEPSKIAFESGWLYVCISSNTWERVALSTFTGSALLLETGDALLLETGDKILLE